METNNIRIPIYLIILLMVILTAGLLLFHIGCSTKHKVHHVGILCGLNVFSDTIDGFKLKMTEFGYLEGTSIVYDVHHTDSEPLREQEIIRQFVKNKVDLVFTIPTIVSLEAKEGLKGTNIPLVFANANIEGNGLVNSIMEPGINLTGVRYPGPDISLKRFEILLELVPNAKYILLPYDRMTTLLIRQLESLRLAADSRGIHLMELPASSAMELEEEISKFKSRERTTPDAVLTIPEPLSVTKAGFKILAQFAEDNKIPLGGASSHVDEYETIMSVTTDNIAVGRQAAVLIDKILNGTPAGSIPVVSAESYIQLNQVAAKKLGIQIPDGLLKQADRVIR